MTPQRERPTFEVHERNRVQDARAPVGRMVRAADLRPILPWIEPASKDVADHLRAFAAKYPDRFEYRDGKLQTRRRP